jgi:hypothetical protein
MVASKDKAMNAANSSFGTPLGGVGLCMLRTLDPTVDVTPSLSQNCPRFFCSCSVSIRARATMQLATATEFESIVYLVPEEEEKKKERNKQSIQLFSFVFQVQIVV